MQWNLESSESVLQWKRQFARSGQISEIHIFAPPNAANAQCRLGRLSPFAPLPAATGGTLVKRAANIHHVSGNYWKGFQGQKTKVNVIARWNVLLRQRDTNRLTTVRPLSVQRRHTDRKCGVDAGLFHFWYLTLTLLRNARVRKRQILWLAISMLYTVQYCHYLTFRHQIYISVVSLVFCSLYRSGFLLLNQINHYHYYTKRLAPSPGIPRVCICIIVTWWSAWSWWASSFIWKTNWFPSVLWHCWFGHMTCKTRSRYDL